MENQNFEEVEGKKLVHQLQDKPGKDEFLIVGIGASAGGIQAMQAFFRHVPVESGMAYVVILHLSPDYESQLASVLQRSTKIPVSKVTERVNIKPDHIYVVAPNQHLTMEDGYIAVSPNITIEERRAPIDIFFRTLGDEHGPRAIAIILSGTGANGSMGLKRVKERGGTCFVQSPQESEFSEMPRNAIATEMVDAVLPVTDIPAKILSYKTGLSEFEIAEDLEKRPDDQQAALREIFTQMRMETGHDFSNYKRPTLLRRIERRINVRGLPDLSTYARFLQDHPDETTALLKDLLVSVTNFFRDKKPFEAVEYQVLPSILKDKTSRDQIRIWVAGCATGEEAYSIAMLCAEKTLGAIDAPKVQIFATDIDEAAIAHAREGLYTLNDTADVSPERLRRFFNKEGESFRIRREIRETIMFASHNFLKDPPFSHLDMVTCRNVMIYLNQVAQERVIETFHFALNRGGYLFLGTAESVDGASDLYSTYSRENHIYQSRQVGPRTYPVPESTPSLYSNKFKNDYSAREQENKMLKRVSFADLHQQLLEEYAPPSLVVNEEYKIVHLTESAAKYLQISGGELSENLLNLVKPELRLDLRSALYQAIQRRSAVEARGLKVIVKNKPETVNIHVRPVLRSGDTANGFILVIFEPATDGDDQEILLSADEPIAKQLEEELVQVKSQLRAANEHHDFQAEEMKASNEELQAMNEELRSAAEELETSKEELQSINEELRTVNQELKIKVEETSITSNDLQNLINSTNIGTIFLDRSFCVVLFTPAAGAIFNLIPADYGRPLSDITNRLEYNNLLQDSEAVLDRLTAIEQEVRTTDGQIFLMRISPYRTTEDRINGVVISFVDITSKREAERQIQQAEEKYRVKLEHEIDERTAQLKESRDLLQATMNSSLNMIQVFEALRNEQGEIVDFKWILNNHASEKIYGDVIGKSLLQNNPGVVETGIFEAFKNVVETGIPDQSERHYIHEQFNGWFYQSAVKLGDGVATTTINITERKKAEQEIIQLKDEVTRRAENKYRHLFNSITEGFIICELIYDEHDEAVDWRWLEVNPAFEEQVDLKSERILGKLRSEVFSASDNTLLERFAGVVRTQQPVEFEEYSASTDKWLYLRAVPFGKNQFAVLFENINKRKRAEMTLRESEERKAFLLKLSDAMRPLSDAMEIKNMACRLLGEHLSVNRAYYSEINEAEGYARVEEYYLRRNATAHAGTYPLDKYSWTIDILRRGEPVIVNDVQQLKELSPQDISAMEKIQQVAVLSMPLFKNGTLLGALTVSENKPRVWKQEEADLVRETLERTWAAAQRGQTEKALRQSEERLQLSIKNSNLFTWEVNPRTSDTKYSDNYNEVLGFKVSTAAGENFLNIYEDDKDFVLQAIHEALKGDAPLDIEHRIVNPDTGEIVWVRAQGQLITRNARTEPVFVGITQNITKRKEAEQALRENEERVRTLTNAVPQIIWTNDENGKANFFNQRWFEFSGLTVEESVGRGWEAIVHPDDAPASKEKWQQSLSAGDIFDTEYRLRRHDGVYRWFIGRNIPLKNAEGKITGWFGSATDIEDLKRAEENLRISEARLKTTMDSARDYAIITLDTHGIVELWSCGAEKIFGYTADEVKGRSADVIFTPEDRAEEILQKEMATAREKGSAMDERWHVKKDGSRFYMSGVMTLIHDGELSGYVKVARDMTEQKQAAEQLRIFEERNRIALQSGEMASWDWNVKTDRIIWNEQHHLVLGLVPDNEEKDAAYFLKFVHPEDKADIEKRLKDAVESTGIYKAEFRIIRADNREVRWVTGFGRAVSWEGNKASRMVGVMFDISERKKLEQQKEEFLGIASHELKTPVTSIKAYGELLEEIFEENGDTGNVSLLQKMNAQINRMNDLISDLLDTTQIAEGELVLNFETFNLIGLIKQLVGELQQLSQKHQLVINCDDVINVYADKKRIEQVITNFISNAIKYSPDGGNVTIKCEFPAGEVKVSVADRGIGIPQESLHKIFNRFFRVKHASSNTFSGMGLGLYITAGIIRRHGGSVGVKNNPDKGSTFYFTLPYKR